MICLKLFRPESLGSPIGDEVDLKGGGNIARNPAYRANFKKKKARILTFDFLYYIQKLAKNFEFNF